MNEKDNLHSESRIVWKAQGKLLLCHAIVLIAALLLPFSRSESLSGMWGVPSMWGLFVVLILPILSPAVLSYFLWKRSESHRLRNVLVFIIVSSVVSVLVLSGLHH